jgi:hypothetical protein
MDNRFRQPMFLALLLLLAGAASCATSQPSVCSQPGLASEAESACRTGGLLVATPSSLVFGGVNVGQRSLLTSTLTNMGNASLTISRVSLSGAGIDVGGIFAGQILQPGQSATLQVTFAPTSPRTVTGSAVVTSSAGDPPATIFILGAGRQPGSRSATLSWIPSASAVAGYHVYSSSISGGPYIRLTSFPVTVTAYIDSAVESGKTYHYVVTAVAGGSESAFSNQVSAAIP